MIKILINHNILSIALDYLFDNLLYNLSLNKGQLIKVQNLLDCHEGELVYDLPSDSRLKKNFGLKVNYPFVLTKTIYPGSNMWYLIGDGRLIILNSDDEVFI